MSTPARAPSGPTHSKASPTHRLPEGAFTPEELERMDRVAPVDTEAALAWMRGEGPDPWPEQSR